MFVVSAARKTAWHVPLLMSAGLCLFVALDVLFVASNARWPTVMSAVTTVIAGAGVVVLTRRLRVAGDKLVVSSVVRRTILDVDACVFTSASHVGTDDNNYTILVHDGGEPIAVGESYDAGRAIARLAGALLPPDSLGARLARDGDIPERARGKMIWIAVAVAGSIGAVVWAVVAYGSR